MRVQLLESHPQGAAEVRVQAAGLTRSIVHSQDFRVAEAVAVVRNLPSAEA